MCLDWQWKRHDLMFNVSFSHQKGIEINFVVLLWLSMAWLGHPRWRWWQLWCLIQMTDWHLKIVMLGKYAHIISEHFAAAGCERHLPPFVTLCQLWNWSGGDQSVLTNQTNANHDITLQWHPQTKSVTTPKMVTRIYLVQKRFAYRWMHVVSGLLCQQYNNICLFAWRAGAHLSNMY